MDKVIEILNEKLDEIYEERNTAINHADYLEDKYEETLAKLRKLCPHKKVKGVSLSTTSLPSDGTTEKPFKFQCMVCGDLFKDVPKDSKVINR